MTMFSYNGFLLPFWLRQLYPSETSEHAANRGTQRRFLPKYIKNTFKVIQSTFGSLEMHSKRSLSGAKKFASVRSPWPRAT